MNRRQLFKGALGVTAAVALPSVAIAATEEVSDPNRYVRITLISTADRLEGTAHIYTRQKNSAGGTRVLALRECIKADHTKFHNRDMLYAHLIKEAKVGTYESSFYNNEAGYTEIRFAG